MERLRQQDLHALNEAIRELYAVRREEGFPKTALSLLKSLFPVSSVSWNWFDHNFKATKVLRDAVIPLAPALYPVYKAYVHEYPLIQQFKEGRLAPGIPCVHKVSDFLSRREFHRFGLYNEFYRQLRTEFHIAMVMPSFRSEQMAITLGRDQRDFTERERRMLLFLQPHVYQGLRNAHEMTRYDRERGLLERAVEQEGRGIIHISRSGRITSITETAKRYLRVYFGLALRAGNRLPIGLWDWLQRRRGEERIAFRETEPLIVDQGDYRLAIKLLCERDGEDAILVLREEDRCVSLSLAPASYGLSRREGEILCWVARGKTNLEIGIILKISPRTVQKHLEHIFVKLGVETRTAAAMVMAQKPPD